MIVRNAISEGRLPPKGRKTFRWNCRSLLGTFLISLIFLYAGIFIGWNMQQQQQEKFCNCNCNCSNPKKELLRRDPSVNEQQSEKQIKDLENEVRTTTNALQSLKQEMKQKLTQETPHNRNLFPPKHTSFAHGMEFVDRDEFAQTFDAGVPLDESNVDNNRVMLIYSDNWALPESNATKQKYPRSGNLLSVQDATKNCNNLHIVFTSDRRRNQCIAIMAQYESFHLHKFMRLTDGPKQSDRNLDKNAPLRLVNRGMQLNGEKSISLPRDHFTKAFWKTLVSYLTMLDDVLKELDPIAKAVAAHNQHNTVVVLVCNLGHADMLLNFVCHARAQGLEESLKNILLFSTDIETHRLATSIGLTSYYNEAVFGGVPSEAAQEYGDQIYSKIMNAKVYCVHLISMLGYDILFQDIDVVWFKDPLEWFHQDKSPSKEYDMVFQDDGARTLFYAPFSANTGFYYVRNNERTKFFLNSLLYMGDQIMSQSSHQSVLIVLLAEHSSLYGLKVKTWNRNAVEFPGGQAYHQRPDFMKQLAARKNQTLEEGIVDNLTPVEPYIFHMSWTKDKTDKLKFFAQMGDWYLKDSCLRVSEVAKNATESTIEANFAPKHCCSAKPLVQCHFRDKPSIIPCKDAPPSTKMKNPSFW